MSLFYELQTNKDARRIFGKKELLIIKKQFLGVNLTQSEKNRLSRDIRKKFEFIEKISEFQDEFKIKKGAVIEELVDSAKKEILKHPMADKVEKIILFGSAAENDLMLRSDIDIAVVFPDINLREATKFRARVLGHLNDKMDVQVYNVLPDEVKKEIDEKGKIIYDKKRKDREEDNIKIYRDRDIYF